MDSGKAGESERNTRIYRSVCRRPAVRFHFRSGETWTILGLFKLKAMKFWADCGWEGVQYTRNRLRCIFLFPLCRRDLLGLLSSQRVDRKSGECRGRSFPLGSWVLSQNGRTNCIWCSFKQLIQKERGEFKEVKKIGREWLKMNEGVFWQSLSKLKEKKLD